MTELAKKIVESTFYKSVKIEHPEYHKLKSNIVSIFITEHDDTTLVYPIIVDGELFILCDDDNKDMNFVDYLENSNIEIDILR